jgi:hypothetical protein
MDRYSHFSHFKLSNFKLYDKILTYPKCGTKYMNNIYGTHTDDNHINFNELFISEINYIIIRDPESHFISAVNETLKYEESLKRNLESILIGANVHWNSNHYRLIEIYTLLHPNKTIVKLENLMSFLEHELKIKPPPFTTEHKTNKLYNMNKLKEEEPYLIGLFKQFLNFEKESYYRILLNNKVYEPKKSLI